MSNRRLKVFSVALAITAYVALFGCVQNINLTPETKYLEAIIWYNDNLELYLAHYKAQAPTVQAVWKEKYHPYFKAGDMALNAWKANLAQGEQQWMEAKKQILNALLTLNIVEVK